MGYLLRVRLASFFTGVATASLVGLHFICKDYQLAHESIAEQMKRVQDALDKRISALEQLKEREASQPVEAAE